jgi:hypothetical protein
MLKVNGLFPVAETVILPSAIPQEEATTLSRFMDNCEIAQSFTMGSSELQFMRKIIMSPEYNVLVKIDFIIG